LARDRNAQTDDAEGRREWERILTERAYKLDEQMVDDWGRLLRFSVAGRPAEAAMPRQPLGDMILEAVRLGIAVRPPHVNASGERFTLTQDAGAATLWMGLGSVRDLRRSAIEQIVRGRDDRPYADLRDLLNRVELQTKETIHLVQCGALDGLGESRAIMLAEIVAIGKAGTSQLAFAFAHPLLEPETPVQRVEWEQHILGQPVSVHPLELVADSLPAAVPLRELPGAAGRPVAIAGTRLPGWTGGPGYFLGDGDSFVIVKSEDRPQPWQPVLLRGRWQTDAYGSGWFQAVQWSIVGAGAARR